MHLSRSTCVVWAVALAICNIKGINTQSDTSSFEGTTEELLDSSTQDLPTIGFNELKASRSVRTQNISSENVEIDTKETPHDKQSSYKPLESASKVIMSVNASPVNEISAANKSKATSTKHRVTELGRDDVRTLLQKNVHNRNNMREHVKYDEVTGELVGGDHPCHRECREGEEPMICFYHFNLEWYQTMSKACFDCPFTESDCSRLDCIPADGMNRPLNVVNRKMPGPAIEVCQHDRVIVDVENDLMTEGTTVHWHGQHQRGTPYMDGTPYVTQCPIPPETTFRYQFNATHSGTHFWHSHSGMQRADGAAGAFIIRKPKSQDPHGRLYDYDRSDHVMIVTDWIHELSIGMFSDHHHSKGDNKPPTLLINGVGRFKVFNNDTERPKYMKAARFNVEQGYKYRFRVINAEFLNCPIELSVDGHNITIISSDGYDLEPITATSLVTYAGERYDFVLEANAEIDNYWIRYRGLMDCDEVVTELGRDDVRTLLQKNVHNRNNMREHVKYDEVTGELVGGDHPCHRECREGEEPMICFYHFNLEWYQTMSKACFDCPFTESDCSRLDCIPADGMNRPLNVVNRKMPGPAIEVCQHDRVIVDVENDLMTEGTTVHWHGQHQRGTPYMDGTPYVTQCPIPPETTFRYQFNATHSGTHFWHSHSGMQRADGAAGAFIIRKPKSQDPHGRLYDYDRSDHVMIVTDWIHELSIGMFSDHHHSKGDNKPPTLLINGVGRFKVFNNDTERPKYMKAARFNVEQGYKYRFRVINAEFLNCPIELSVDGHNITIISSDGYDLEPITATSLVTYAGERYDFVLEANAEIDNYWIRYRGLMDCDEVFTRAKQVGVLHYEGAMESEPEGDPTWFELHNEGLQLNALNKGEEDDETISVAEMRSLDGWDESLKEVADYQFYVAYDFYAKNNSHFHRSPYYGYYQVPDTLNRLYTPQLNHISMKMPSSPLLVSRPSPDNFCNSSSIDDDCRAGYCECSHVLSVKLNSVVEVIIVDEGVTFDANHPFHLHGHSFRVVGLRRLATETTIEDIQAFDKAGLLKRNLKNAPIKDTVTVPDGGYTVIRFKADNPGYWLFHCHIEFHVEIGMALVFKVGDHKDMTPIPKDFPRCGNYMPDNMLELATTEQPKTDQHISISHWWPVVVVNANSTSSAVNLSLSILVVLCSLCIFKLNGT